MIVRGRGRFGAVLTSGPPQYCRNRRATYTTPRHCNWTPRVPATPRGDDDPLPPPNGLAMSTRREGQWPR